MKFKLIIITLLFTIFLMAENENIGTTGFAFLKINYSARAVAMADAYTALANDANAVFYNTAGIEQIKSQQTSVSYMNYFDGIQTGAASYVKPLNSKITVATFIKYMSGSDTRTLTDSNGDYQGEDGTFGFSNSVIGIGASRYINDILSAITDAAAKGDEIALNGFGKFKVKTSAARQGRNPSTGETIQIAESKRLTFSAAKAVKDRLNA